MRYMHPGTYPDPFDVFNAGIFSKQPSKYLLSSVRRIAAGQQPLGDVLVSLIQSIASLIFARDICTSSSIPLISQFLWQ